MPEGLNATALFWSIVGLLFGGGAIGAIAWRAVVHKLSESFVPTRVNGESDPVIRQSDVGDFAQEAELMQFRDQFKHDLDGIGRKVDGVTSLYTGLSSHVDEHIEQSDQRIGKLEAANDYGWAPLNQQVADLRKGLEERDRKIERELGNLRGILETHMSNLKRGD